MNNANAITDARMLSALYNAPSDQVLKVRKRYISRRSEVTAKHLLLVQDVLNALAGAVHANCNELWEKVEQAAHIVTAQSVTEPATPEPATTELATTEPATTELATTEPATTEPATSEPATPPERPIPSPPAPVHAPMGRDQLAPAPAIAADDAPSPWTGTSPTTDEPSPWAEGVTSWPSCAGAELEESLLMGTAELDGDRLLAHDGATIPFERARTGVLPQLTVQQYAQLCAQVAERPEEIVDIYRTFRVADAATHRMLAEAWHQRLMADAAQRDLFDLLYGRLRAQLQASA